MADVLALNWAIGQTQETRDGTRILSGPQHLERIPELLAAVSSMGQDLLFVHDAPTKSTTSTKFIIQAKQACSQDLGWPEKESPPCPWPLIHDTTQKQLLLWTCDAPALHRVSVHDIYSYLLGRGHQWMEFEFVAREKKYYFYCQAKPLDRGRPPTTETATAPMPLVTPLAAPTRIVARPLPAWTVWTVIGLLFLGAVVAGVAQTSLAATILPFFAK